MVIERALEKMRQANADKALQTPAPLSPAGAGTGTHAYRQPASSAVARPTVKPVFPQVDCDLLVANGHRVLIPNSRMAEDARASAAYRMLRTRLVQRLRKNNWSAIAVTSPAAGDGKSLTSLNLALNLARDNANDVFLIDLDMRNPSLCRYLGVRPPHEITQFFMGEGTSQDLFFSIGISNLSLAGGVLTTEGASELLATGKLEELIAYIRSVAPSPLIFIDLPPVLVTDEALLAAPRVDAMLLVVSEGRTRRDDLSKASQLLAEFPFAGIVLNRSSESFGDKSGYYYGNQYGQS